MQPSIERMLTLTVAELKRRGWVITWLPDGVTAAYRQVCRFGVYLARTFVQLQVSTRTVRVGAECLRMVPWDRRNQLRVTCPEEVNDDFLAAFQRLLTQAEEIAARFHERKGKK